MCRQRTGRRLPQAAILDLARVLVSHARQTERLVRRFAEPGAEPFVAGRVSDVSPAPLLGLSIPGILARLSAGKPSLAASEGP